MPGGYFVSKYETRQKEFERIMGYTPSMHKGSDLPVEHVSVDESLDFCVKLTELESQKLPEGMVYALPSYEEWLEYVADASLENANIKHSSSIETTTKRVDSGESNRLGIYCIRGNVAEFSRDITATPDASNIILGADYLESRKYRLMPTHKAGMPKRNDKSLNLGFRIVIIPKSKNVSAIRNVGIDPDN